MYHLAVTLIWTILVFLIYLALYLFCTYGVWRFKDNVNNRSGGGTVNAARLRGNVIEIDEMPLALSIDDESSEEIVGEMV